MGDIELDLQALRTAKGRVSSALETFRSADRVGEDLAELTGEHRLARKVRDFAGNWDHNRGKLEEQLVAVRDWLEAIDETMTELDRSMGDGVDTDEDAP
ncbi:hypothetical protein [Microbacterium sp. Root180]|uniref:hypothetical protein n=1 Tax=Microbacterium sp. Root180 TaxID=1736483 RepID=UPI000701AC97|nr:hypothetical protein [Microbacterium sp. Root180]KRB37130.1 hypothetical protein ASD93_14140 [Microbacterium sp. Root180]